MSIKLMFFNFIIPKSVVREKYKGGLEAFIGEVPNQTFEEDEDLVTVGFMNEVEAEYYKKFLITKRGFEFENNRSNDFVITAQFFPNLWEVDWLEKKGNEARLKKEAQ